MVFITAELYKNAGVDVIKDNRIDVFFFLKGGWGKNETCSKWIRFKNYKR